MINKYFNDAIFGNDSITASINRQGKLLRVFYPSPNFKQQMDFIDIAFKVNNQQILYTHDDIASEYNQYFIKNTNVVKTEITAKNHNLKMVQTDFAPIGEDLIIRNYNITNTSDKDITLKPIITSKVIASIHNEVGSYITEDALVHYNHDYSICVFTKQPINKQKIYNAENDIENGDFDRYEYIGMSDTASISYEELVVSPNESIDFPIYIYVNNNNKRLISELELEIIRIKKISTSDREEEAIKYWESLVKKHTKHDIARLPEKVQNIYSRTMLLYELLIDKNTSGISAALEIDEEKTKSGRYSFVWPRDVLYVFKTFNMLGFSGYTDKFLDVFARKTQSRSGRWEQRFYTDGNLGTSWGYQIDETAAIIEVAYYNYIDNSDKKFLKKIMKMIESGYRYLMNYSKQILDGKKSDSFDLWETYMGESLYGVASVFSAIDKMRLIYEDLKNEYKDNRLKVEQINKELRDIEVLLPELKDFIVKTFYNTDRGSYVRNTEDNKIDISALSLVVPFNVFKPDEKLIKNTIDSINMSLKTHTGGYIRFENDGYLGGYHPWTIANLWMALYNLEQGNYDEAKKNFNFVVNTSSKHGYIAEQVSNETMQPEWVIGLSWAHGMFMVLLDKLLDKGILE